MQETQVQSLCWKDSLAEGMATHSSILVWRIHGQKSLVGCSPEGCKRVGHDFATEHTHTHTHTHTHSVQYYKFLSKRCVHSVPQILISCIFIFIWFILSFFSEMRSLIHVLFGSVVFNLPSFGNFFSYFFVTDL